MPRTLPTKAARKQAFDLRSAQLEVEIAHAEWQYAYVGAANVAAGADTTLCVLDTPPEPRDVHSIYREATRWSLEKKRLVHELASLKLAYLAEETRIAALKGASASHSHGTT